jgi:hypothetical protein
LEITLKPKKRILSQLIILTCTVAMLLSVFIGQVSAADLIEIKQKGVLRHLGVPYAKFVTGSGDGMDTELIKRFAEYLGVHYKYVMTSWNVVIGDLTGKAVIPKGNEIEILGDVPVKGDIIANGLTILPWRKRIVDYSQPTFPSGVWLIARSDSSLEPIVPSGDIQKDITAVRSLLQGKNVFAVENSCLDPNFHRLYDTGAKVRLFSRDLNQIAPAVINNESETSLLDVPDALIALKKWPGQIKVIGPITPMQEMACGFAKTSPQLREAFNRFLKQCKKDGTYLRLAEKYYPSAFIYFPEFFR